MSAMHVHPRLRTRALSDSSQLGRPQPAKYIFDAPKRDATTMRSTMPRAASAMNMRANMALDGDHMILEEDPESAFRDIAREQVEKEALRELAYFFRTTSPPEPPVSSTEKCFGKAGPGDNRRWSLRSLKRGSKMASRQLPLSQQMRDSAMLKTTAAGHPYNAILVPSANGTADRRASLQSRISSVVLQRQRDSLNLRSASPSPSLHVLRGTGPTSGSPLKAGEATAPSSRPSPKAEADAYRSFIRAATPEPGVKSFMKLVDEWLEDHETELEAQEQPDQPESKGTHHTHESKASAVTLLTPGSPGQPAEEHEGFTPKIMLNPALRSPSTSPPAKLPEPESAVPMTPPPIEGREMSFPKSSPNHRRSDAIRPQTPSAASATSHKSVDSRSQFSPFPNTASSKGTSSPKTNSPRSPKQHQRRPTNIIVKNNLAVPKVCPLPESPGFPTMLAAMTFPSPPESAHSPTDSISSNIVARPPTAPPAAERSSYLSQPPSSLDQRIMPEGRPPLRHYKSDGTAQLSYMSHASTTGNAGTLPLRLPETPTDATTRSQLCDTSTRIGKEAPPEGPPAPSVPAILSTRSSEESLTPQDSEAHRQSATSAADSTRASYEYTDQPSRLSLRSDTSVSSDITETTEAYNNKQRNKYRDSMSSIRSISSASTSATATSLAERRMARRARVREKLQREIDASKTDVVPKFPSRGGLHGSSEAMDSPVLGWFPQNVPHGLRRTSVQGSSPLANGPSTVDSPTRPMSGKTLDHMSRRSSIQNISQLIPETVQESEPVTFTLPEPAPLCTLSPIIVEETEPASPTGSKPDKTAPILAMTPIMVVANIENIDTRSPTSSLRPLSLLTNASSSPPSLPPRSSLRNGRQRPLPIRVSKNPLDLTVKTNLKSQRNSSPSVPTPPMSPDSSSPPRTSLPGLAKSAGGGRSSSSNSQPTSATTAKRAVNQPQSAVDTPETESPTQWLTAHQRQTAQDWRQSALKDRMRVEKEAEEREAAARALQESQADDSDESGPGASDGEKLRRLQREEHRQGTLRNLNANSALSRANSTLSKANSTLSRANSVQRKASLLHSRVLSPDPGTSADSDVEQRLLRAIVPLLENMSNTLKEMQRDSASRALTMKFIDSTLAIASPLADAGDRRVVSYGSSVTGMRGDYRSSPGLGERVKDGQREVLKVGRLSANGYKRHGRSLSLPSTGLDGSSSCCV